MLNSAVLEVTIGILLVFLLVSTVCTAIREGIEAKLKTRAAYLEAGIRELLRDPEGNGLARAFFEHPIIYCLYSGKYQPGPTQRRTLAAGRNLPSYVSGRTFALAVIDIVARGKSTDAASGSPDLPPMTLSSLRQNVQTLGNPHLQRMLLMAIDSAEGDLERVRQNLHGWFDDSMGRVSGWYKRSTQKILFVIALLVVGTLNINTITIAQYLYRNDFVRAELVATAERTAEAGTKLVQNEALEKLLDLPLGWDQGYGAPEVKPWANKKPFQFWNDLVGTVFGLLVTVFAAMLGAPFWFDLLGRVTAIRSTFKPEAALPRSQAEQATSSSPGVAQATDTALLVMSSSSTSGTASSAAPQQDEGDPCDHAHTDDDGDGTPDEDLPPARGGVAE